MRVYGCHCGLHVGWHQTFDVQTLDILLSPASLPGWAHSASLLDMLPNGARSPFQRVPTPYPGSAATSPGHNYRHCVYDKMVYAWHGCHAACTPCSLHMRALISRVGNSDTIVRNE